MVGRNKWLGFALLVLTVVLLNWVSQLVFWRLDFTREKRFTLTAKTKALLKKTPHQINVTLFLSGQMPAPFKRLRTASADLLADYKAYAHGGLSLEFVDPLDGADANERDTIVKDLYQIGIQPTNVKIKSDEGFAERLLFPMAMVSVDGKQIPVKLLQNTGGAAGNYEESINNAIQNLEYVFTSAIKKVTEGYNPRIGFTEGNGEPSNVYLYDAITSLSDSYLVGRVDLNAINKAGLDSLKLLVVNKPSTALNEAQKYKINYFIMNGGSVIFALDQSNATLDQLGDGGTHLFANKELNLDDMLFTYGARINYNLLADVNCAEIPVSTGASGIQLAPWIYYPLLQPQQFNAVTKGLDPILGTFASTIDTIAVPQINKTVLLSSSAYAKAFDLPKAFSLQMVAQQPNPKAFYGQPKPVAVLLEGVFNSVFANRSVPENIKEQYTVPNVGQPAKMVVIADGDIFTNQVSSTDGAPFPLGYDRYTQQNYGNKTLLLNLVDYMSNKENLIELRSKELKIRLLDKQKVKAEKLYWQLLNLLAPLALLICFAIFQHYWRRLKYAR